ncbi:hypothetical protein KCU81_g4977, partial [Aureobasidium melanogenum]|uniref:Uncharacterized protein n=1 Tax=Aureobasidium melanogenum (strain CBS 110374) TaxID=1043003 RepID=A0A074VN69_AURM1
MLSPIIASSPLRISSPLRATIDANDEKSNGLGISSPRQSIEKSPLLAKTPSLSRSIASTSSVESADQPSTAYVQSSRTYHPSRVPTAYVPSPHGTHLYSPKHLPKAVVSAIADEASKQPAAALRLPKRTSSISHQTPIVPKRAPPVVPQRTPSVSQYIPIELQRPLSVSRRIPVVPQRAPTLPQIAPTALQRPPAVEITPIQTTSLYTSRRVSSTFLTPTSHMGPPLITNPPSPERELDTFPSSPPVHMPLTRPTNLYQSRRAPTPYNHAAQNTGPLAPSPLAPRRVPVAYTPASQSRVPSSMLAPPPSVRRLNSARNRGHSFASNTSSVYSRLVTDPK